MIGRADLGNETPGSFHETPKNSLNRVQKPSTRFLTRRNAFPTLSTLYTISPHFRTGNIGPAAAPSPYITLPKPAKHISQIFDERVIDE
jgi:hypothetical protein